MLQIENLHARTGGRDILKGVTLTVQRGEVHAVMGPNGSGKSTLASIIAGRPGYEVTAGSVRLDGIDLLGLEPEERAHRGVFLAFQYPVEIPGVSNMEFLKAALDSRNAAAGEDALSAMDFMRRARTAASRLDLNPEFLKRGVNEGFSGGEKKRNEILQMLLLEPTLAVLDETDSGLDIDALRVVAAGVNTFASPTTRWSSSPTTSACSTTSCPITSTCSWRAASCARATRTSPSSSSPTGTAGWPTHDRRRGLRRTHARPARDVCALARPRREPPPARRTRPPRTALRSLALLQPEPLVRSLQPGSARG